MTSYLGFSLFECPNLVCCEFVQLLDAASHIADQLDRKASSRRLRCRKLFAKRSPLLGTQCLSRGRIFFCGGTHSRIHHQHCCQLRTKRSSKDNSTLYRWRLSLCNPVGVLCHCKIIVLNIEFSNSLNFSLEQVIRATLEQMIPHPTLPRTVRLAKESEEYLNTLPYAYIRDSYKYNSKRGKRRPICAEEVQDDRRNRNLIDLDDSTELSSRYSNTNAVSVVFLRG